VGIVREKGDGVEGDGGSGSLMMMTILAAGDAVTEIVTSTRGRQTLPSSRQQQHSSTPPRMPKKRKVSWRRRKKNLDHSKLDGDALALDCSSVLKLESRLTLGEQSGGEEGLVMMGSSSEAHKSSSHRESEE